MQAPSSSAAPYLPPPLTALPISITLQTPNVQQQPTPYQNNIVLPSLPKKIYDLPEFSGSPEDWTMFLTAFEHSTAAYQYCHFEIILRLQKALKGEARECANANIVIEQIKFQYDDLLILCHLQQVREILR